MKRSVLLLAILAGAWLRFHHLGAPSLWLDEILGYDLASRLAHAPLWRWITGIESENGALYYLSELAGRLFHSIEFSARVAPALFGVLTIAIAWLAEAPLFALLLACSPLHIYYSREGRPYALLLLITTAILIALLRDKPRMAMALLIAAAYTSATSFPLIATTLIAALLLKRWNVAITASICAAAIPLLYCGGAQVPSFPPFTMRLLRDALDSFSAVALDHTHLHRVAYAFLAFAIIGAVDAMRRDRRRGLVIIAFAILPASISLAALWRLNHFYAIRYLAASLPGFLLLVALGITFVATLTKRAAPVVALLIVIVLVRDGLRSAQIEPYQKLDWRAIAATLEQHVHDGDFVIAGNHWTYASLGFYLGRTALRIHYLDAQSSARLAEIFAGSSAHTWFVDAGEPSLRSWLCRYPLLLGSPFESFRLHYGPSLHDFLIARSTRAEQRALATTAIGFGPEDDVYLGSEWSGADAEHDHFARWAIGRTATIALPLDAPRDRDVVIDVEPTHYRGSSPQRLALSINGSATSEVVLRDERQTITIHGSRDRWREGVNVLTFTLDHAVAPATIDRQSTDRRELSVRFSRVAIDDAQPKGALHRARLNVMLDEPQVIRERPLPAAKNRAEVVELLARLGFDPQVTSVDLTCALNTFADESNCSDDDRFVRDAWSVVIGERINEPAFRDCRRLLERGVSRRGLLRALVTSDDMRRRLSLAPFR